MITLSTSVLVRALVTDPVELDQCQMARHAMSQAKAVYVPQIVQAELASVLSSAYKFTKNQVVGVLEHMQENMAFVLQKPEVFSAALQKYVEGKSDFAACIIQVEAEVSEAAPVVTFEINEGKLRLGKLSTSN